MSYRIAVRALCEFAAKAGDLDRRFTPAPSAREGIAGHGVVAARRAEGYEREITLSGDYRQLQVRGRADGFDPTCNRLEEVKTFRGDLALMPANHRALHWAQAKVYGHLLCQARGLDGLRLALVYFDVASQKETLLEERFSATALQAFFEEQCERFIDWAEREMAHRRRRDALLGDLSFPHAGFRDGQRPLAEAVYKAASTGRCLMLQAPTGIGKTLGTLFPMLKAMPTQHLDKLFYLAAKTPGRRLALDALATLVPDSEASALCKGESALRVLELTARDKACEHPDKACHGEACPLAQGFYDRLPEARRAAANQAMLDQAALRRIALDHRVCPYYLGQEMTRWSDVIVGDYNYYFDLNAPLYGLSVANQWRVAVLVDEAHNLVARARGMYGAELDQTRLKRLRRRVPRELNKPLARVERQWRALNAEAAEGKEDESAYRVLEAPPSRLLNALQKATAAITEHMATRSAETDAALQEFHLEALHLCRVAELFDEHSLVDLSLRSGRRAGRVSTLCFRNVVPASFLAPRFAASHTTVLFSATLSPHRYHADLLGVPADAPWLEVASPFAGEQLKVRINERISTRYRHRHASLVPIAELMAAQFAATPGNYLAFFSSFDYLEQVAEAFCQRYPHILVWRQARRMDELARQDFLDRFVADGRGIGFAVLGGVFGEGIDLPGTRLVGAFIATLGLPQMNPVNEQFKTRLAALFGDGYAYAYLYPGLQKVVQAAGRVIRTRSDEGVVHLIDDRFAQPLTRQLLPGWWENIC